jgi:hypothetical protein
MLNLRGLLAAAIALSLTGCFTWPGGISPISPKHGQTVPLESATLSWKPVPLDGAESLQYQVSVLDSLKTVVYENVVAQGTSHRVEGALAPGRYQWTVRPLYLRNGSWKEGRWNRRKYFYFAGVLFGWGETLYEFKASDEPAVRQQRRSPSSRRRRTARAAAPIAVDAVEETKLPKLATARANAPAGTPVIDGINAQVSAVLFFVDDSVDNASLASHVRKCESAKFSASFDRSTTRFVQLCVFLSPHGKFAAGTADLSMALRRGHDNSLVLWFPVTTVTTDPASPYFMLLQGYGADIPGEIEAGKYVLEVLADNVKVGGGTFEVLQ